MDRRQNGPSPPAFRHRGHREFTCETGAGFYPSGAKPSGERDHASAAPGASQTIFDGGADPGNLLLAKAQRDRAIAVFETAAQAAERIARVRYDGGADTYLNLLIAQRSPFAAQQSLVGVQLLRAERWGALCRIGRRTGQDRLKRRDPWRA